MPNSIPVLEGAPPSVCCLRVPRLGNLRRDTQFSAGNSIWKLAKVGNCRNQLEFWGSNDLVRSWRVGCAM